MGSVLLGIGILISAVLIWRRPSLRWEMLAGALAALPYLLISPLANDHLSASFTQVAVVDTLLRVGAVAVTGALAAAIYRLFIQGIFPQIIHPLRGLLVWLILGPVLAIGLFLITGQSLVVCAGLGLALDIILVLMLWRGLVWDALTAMIGMALLYLVLLLLFGMAEHGFTLATGILLFQRPLEEILRALAFGALWGPPFAAVRALGQGETLFPWKKTVPKQVVVAGSAVLLILLYAWVNLQFVLVPQVIAASPGESGKLQTLASEVSLQLNRPFDRDAVQVKIEPEVAGSVSFDDSYLQRSFVRRIVFAPDAAFAPNTSYTLTVSSLKSILGQTQGDYSYTFHTPSLPEVVAVTPAPDATDVAICNPLGITLSQPTGSIAEFTFAIDPPIEFETQQASQQDSFMLTPKTCFSQSQTYTLSILRRATIYGNESVLLSAGEPELIKTVSFTTKGAPGISSVTPQGGDVLTTAKNLTVKFSEPMLQSEDLSKFFSLSPAIPGSWSWVDDQTATYAFANTLPFNTSYTLAMTYGLKDQKGGFIPQNVDFSFATIGHVKVSGVSPFRGSAGVKTSTSISITFDQQVDKASAEERFSISPAVGGSFSWQDRTMIYKTSLSKDTTYQITVAAGVKSLVGLDMVSAYTSSFATEESTTLLNIAQYYQKYALSCEVASLKMALAGKGITVSEEELFNKLPLDSSHRNGNTWADPDVYFVGDVNGRQNTTGYGTHPAPIALVAKQYHAATTFYGWTVQQLADSIAKGNAVVIWGVAGPSKKDSWVTPEGKPVNTWVGEHVRTVVGFTGKVDSPTSFIINDPIYGRLKWSTSQLKANWGMFGNMGVAIL